MTTKRQFIIVGNAGYTVREIQGAPSLEDMQSGVGGYIQLVPGFTKYKGDDCVAFCNEEGKLKGLPINALATVEWRKCAPRNWDILVGDIVVITGDRQFLDSL